MVGADSAHSPACGPQHVGDGPSGVQSGTGRPRRAHQMGGGQGRHHLRVLRVMDGAGETRRKVRFKVVEFVGRDGDRLDPGGALLDRKFLEGGEPLWR